MSLIVILSIFIQNLEDWTVEAEEINGGTGIDKVTFKNDHVTVFYKYSKWQAKSNYVEGVGFTLEQTDEIQQAWSQANTILKRLGSILQLEGLWYD